MRMYDPKPALEHFTRGNMGNLGVVIIDVNIDVEFSTSLSMVLELFGNTQG